MEYAELIEKVLQGRTVNAAAKAIGVPQPSLDKYVKGNAIPGCDNGYKMVLAAGVDIGEGFEALANAARLHKLKRQAGFVQIGVLPFIGGVGIVVLSILCQLEESAELYMVILVLTPRSHLRPHVY